MLFIIECCIVGALVGMTLLSLGALACIVLGLLEARRER